ncbi:cytidylate kinase [Aster yellows witches'-broom phytoplasma AYWB]|uniref:Cytidylate kinase n=2 Tax=16SrI (Aster yellows group) TaxID=3042590 RepID=KCY_AYWBP|nr:RecName: Full=Cytidylate kinase; Short=CK; AltName: Full=Cytidine monophosphate kinase; Short=CMP kinase [Aster yellows witches'-broom phytoplasma AYWB]ABC65599.1 cytidylate kinase [Aster yellows witches'-broom phytoplasma AYWB]
MHMRSFKIAIDGPAGSGKSTISKKLSQKLGWNHIDTGAMFRALTLYLLENEVSWHNEKSLNQILDKINLSYSCNKIFLNQEDVSLKIKSLDVEKHVSSVALIPGVRTKLLKLQKEICANTPNLIMDGRDIGTVVMPDANLKIFLTANITKRALRKQQEDAQNGKITDITQIMKQLKERDHKDYHRHLAPLSKALDAILLDTTELSIDELIAKITTLIEKKRRA